MTLTLDLPDDLERKLEQSAARAGLPLAEYLVGLLAASVARQPASSPSLTGAELVAIWEAEGLIGTRPDITDPVKYARELRERNQNGWRNEPGE